MKLSSQKKFKSGDLLRRTYNKREVEYLFILEHLEKQGADMYKLVVLEPTPVQLERNLYADQCKVISSLDNT